MIKKIGFPLAAVLLVTTLAATGYWMLFSSFAVYDDEGYILLSVRDYFAHGHLYETVYSQYGPAFYVLWDTFQHLASAPVDHTWARLATLVCWLGTAICCALLVRRHTKSGSLSLFTLAATFLFLYFITDEPFHPGSLICLALGASVCGIASLISNRKISGAAAIGGATGVFLLLTKINVGVFYLAALAGWAAIHAVSPRIRRLSGPGVIIAFIVLAVALMHALAREAWVQTYLVLFASGAITLVVAMKGEALLTPRHTGWFVASGVALGLAIPALVWMRGTSPAGLLEGVVLGPLRHPGNYSYPVDWRPGSLAMAGLSLLLAALYPWIGRRFSHEAADRLIVILRLTMGAALLAGFALLINFRAVGAIFSYVAPLIWIWVVPLDGVEIAPTDRATRGLLATVLLLQFLHAYPVGGSQESWGVFLFFPLLGLGLGDIRRRFISGPVSGLTVLSPWRAIATLILAVLLAKVGWSARAAQSHYTAGSSLELPGAAGLHLPELQAAGYRILSLNAAVHCDMLFSLPGMFSFNVWTGLPTPTDKNTTLWFSLLNSEEQRAIIEALDGRPRAGIIVQESLLELMQANALPMRGELWDYVHRNFSVAFRSEGFAFWIRTGRSIAPLNIATASFLNVSDERSPPRDTRLDFNLVGQGTPIATIEVKSDANNQVPPLVLDGRNSLVMLTPINSAARPMAESAPATWPLNFRGPVHIRLFFNHGNSSLSRWDTLLHLRGARAENLGEILLGQ